MRHFLQKIIFTYFLSLVINFYKQVEAMDQEGMSLYISKIVLILSLGKISQFFVKGNLSPFSLKFYRVETKIVGEVYRIPNTDERRSIDRFKILLRVFIRQVTKLILEQITIFIISKPPAEYT